MKVYKSYSEERLVSFLLSELLRYDMIVKILHQYLRMYQIHRSQNLYDVNYQLTKLYPCIDHKTIIHTLLISLHHIHLLILGRIINFDL